jgi:hypothetical protein
LDEISAIKKSMVTVKTAFVVCTYYRFGLCHCCPNVPIIWAWVWFSKPFEDLLEASGVNLNNVGAFEYFGSFGSTFRTTKLLCLMD